MADIAEIRSTASRGRSYLQFLLHRLVPSKPYSLVLIFPVALAYRVSPLHLCFKDSFLPRLSGLSLLFLHDLSFVDDNIRGRERWSLHCFAFLERKLATVSFSVSTVVLKTAAAVIHISSRTILARNPNRHYWAEHVAGSYWAHLKRFKASTSKILTMSNGSIHSPLMGRTRVSLKHVLLNLGLYASPIAESYPTLSSSIWEIFLLSWWVIILLRLNCLIRVISNLLVSSAMESFILLILSRLKQLSQSLIRSLLSFNYLACSTVYYDDRTRNASKPFSEPRMQFQPLFKSSSVFELLHMDAFYRLIMFRWAYALCFCFLC